MFSLKSLRFASPIVKNTLNGKPLHATWNSLSSRVTFSTNNIAYRGIATNNTKTGLSIKSPFFRHQNSKYGALLIGIPLCVGAAGVALCDKKAIPIEVKSYETPVGGAIVVRETEGKVEITDRLGRISFGFLLGFVAGFAAKKIGKFVLVAAGTFFLIVQYLSYRGYLMVNWSAVATKATPVTDPAKRRRVLQSVASILTHNLLIKTGFFSGLALGFRFG